MMLFRRLLIACCILCLTLGFDLYGKTYYVEAGEVNGDGDESSPFGTIALGLADAMPGDTVMVAPGTYEEQVSPPRDGAWGAPIVLLGDPAGERPLIYRALEDDSRYVVDNHYKQIVFENLIFDGGYGDRQIVRIRGEGPDSVVLRNCEVRYSTRDGIDINGGVGVLIENCYIHHLLNGTFNDQADAHGITGGRFINLTIRNCNISHVTGDCFQADPGRSRDPYWDNVLIENTNMWTSPLEEDAVGWKAGEIPGENAIDTKVERDLNDFSTLEPPLLILRNIKAWGFTKGGYINNRAAFNLKEKVKCILENVEVFDCEIAYRLRGARGGAEVTLINSLIYRCDKAIRAEDDLKNLHVYNCTIGDSVGIILEKAPRAAGLDTASFEMKNCLMLGEIPPEVTRGYNLTAEANWFADLEGGDYHLVSDAPAARGGEPLPEVTIDFEGNLRSASSPSLGVYEAAGGDTPSCDINGDGKANILDVISLIIMAGENPSDPLVDWDRNGAYSISDAIALVIAISDGTCL